MSEIGYQAQSLLAWSGMLAETHETNPDLMWPKSIDVFDRMRREDPQVTSVLRAVTLPIMRTEWMIDPAGARAEVVDLVATDLGLPVKGQAPAAPVRTRGRFSWGEHLRLALLELPFGHSFFEQVYDTSTGQARLAKLAWRPPRTISSVNVEPDGGLKSIEQHGIAGKRDAKIPVDRLVAYVNEREGANWLGSSMLRPAYKMWLLKDRLLRIQALTAERNGLGVAVYEASPPPEGASPEEIEAWRKSELESGLKMARDSRAGDTAGAAIPSGAKFTFQGVTGDLPDTEKPIRYYDEQIARAVLAHFLNLGTETGSWALGSTFANFFTDSLNAVALHIADVTQQHVVEDLVDLNWGESEPAPRIVPATIGSEHPATADAIKALIDCGALTPDGSLEAHMRATYALPVQEQTTEPATGDGGGGEVARQAADIARMAYLATDKPPLRQDEVRGLIRAAGYPLNGDGPDVSRIASPEEAV